MTPRYENLHADHLDLDKSIPLTFFSKKQIGESKHNTGEKCIHLGHLIKDRTRTRNGVMVRRLKCSKCGQRSGRGVNALDLLTC